MIRHLAFLLLVGAAAGSTATAAEPETKVLFDGKSLDGWAQVGPGGMKLEDGALRTDGGMGLFWYTREAFGDCVIRVVYKTTSPRSNSGVFIRIADRPKDPWFAVHHGYEVQICDGADPFHRRGRSTRFRSRPPRRRRSASGIPWRSPWTGARSGWSSTA